MTEEKPSALPSLPELPDALKKQSPAAIAGRIKAEYDKVNGVYASYTKDATPLRDRCTAVRTSVQSVVESVTGAQSAATTKLADMVEPTPSMNEYKDKVFNFRREYKVAIVGGIAGLSVLSAAFAPGKIEKIRIALRNFLVFGGGATFLLYPEFAYPNAQKVAGKIAEVAEQARAQVPPLR